MYPRPTRFTPFIACGIAMLAALGCSGDPALTPPGEVAAALADASPGDEKATLQESSRTLQQADRDGRIEPARRRALSDLYTSAMRDGQLSDDERTLLATMVHDLAGSLE